MKGIALGLYREEKGYLWYDNKITIPDEEELRTETIRRNHDTPQAGHGGTAKNLELISRSYYWPKIREDIKQYVKNCEICQRTKTTRHAPYGLLKPLEAPGRPWESIAMDFIAGLPESNGYDAIWVVIDRLTKMAHFRPCRTDMNTTQFFHMFKDQVFRLHGLPKDIISDRGSLFTSDKWEEITR